MKIDINDNKHIVADEGKVLVRISTGRIYGFEVYLDKANVNGKIVDDVPENFTEIDYVEEVNNNDFDLED